MDTIIPNMITFIRVNGFMEPRTAGPDGGRLAGILIVPLPPPLLCMRTQLTYKLALYSFNLAHSFSPELPSLHPLQHLPLVLPDRAPG